MINETKQFLQKSVKTSFFIQKSVKKHGNKFDYSKVNYINSTTKVCIICPEHGEFMQTPSNHLYGFDCNECAIESRAARRRNTTKNFIDRANLIHDNKYTYNKSVYVKTHNKVIITCPEHGDFEQTPASHLSGKGCPNCKHRNQSTEDVIKRCTKIHGSNFDYSKVIYINMKNKVEIKCNICKTSFMQSLDKHINSKQGCPTCQESKGENLIRQWLINNNIEYFPQYKINLGKLCIERQNIKVDFFLNNYKCVIEYDGKQHFEYDAFYHKNSIKNFDTQLKRDNALKEFCTNNNYKLIRFKYTQSDKEILKLLKTELIIN